MITTPIPPTTTATVVTATAGYQPYPVQGYPPQHYSAAGTDTKTAPPPPYTAQSIEMSAYPPKTQAAHPPKQPYTINDYIRVE